MRTMALSLFALAALAAVPAAFAAGPADDWTSIKDSLSAGEGAETVAESISHLDGAVATYEAGFQAAALDVDPESDRLVLMAFGDIRQNHNDGDTGMAALNRQIVDKTIYKIAYMKMEEAVRQDDADGFVSWYSVLDKKFAVSEKDYGSNGWISDIRSDPSGLAANGPLVLEEMLAIFQLKTLEELEEAIAALDAGDLEGAKKFAYEGLYYYRTLHPAVADRLGAGDAGRLYDGMAKAIDVVQGDMSLAGMKAEIEAISADTELLIRQYEGGDTSEAGLALSGIRDRLILVDVEYVDAVEGGVIVNQVEYDETVVFLAKAKEILESARPVLEGLSEPDTAAIAANLDEIDSVVSSMGSSAEVTVLVGRSLNNVASLEELSGGAVETDIMDYFDEIDRLLAEASSAYRAGDSQRAHALVSEAYLDNYEFIEGPLGEVDRELMLTIEEEMRVNLREMIEDGEPADAVDAQISMITSDLSVARATVPEFGAVVMAVLVAAIAATVILGSKSRLAVMPRI